MNALESAILTQATTRPRIALLGFIIPDRHGQGFFGTYHDHKLFSPGNRRVYQVALEQDVVLGQQGDNHSRVFGVLGFMDGYRVGQAHQQVSP